MTKIIGLILLLGVAWAMWQLLGSGSRKKGKPSVWQPFKTPLSEEDLIVKKRYVPSQRQTECASVNTGEPSENKEDKFAPESKTKYPARIPDERLDKVFSNPQPEEPDEEITVEFEQEEDINLEEEQAEYTNLSEPTQELASGVEFDRLGEAIETVVSPAPSDERKQRAAEVLGELNGSDIVEQLRRCSPDISNRITELIDSRFNAPKQTATPATPSGSDADFDILDFV